MELALPQDRAEGGKWQAVRRKFFFQYRSLQLWQVKLWQYYSDNELLTIFVNITTLEHSLCMTFLYATTPAIEYQNIKGKLHKRMSTQVHTSVQMAFLSVEIH